MTKLTRGVCSELMTGMEEELAALFNKHGVTGEVKSAKMDRNGRYATFSVQVSVLQANGVASTPERSAYLQNARLYGVEADWLGREFTINQDRVVLTGLNPKAKKYPFVLPIVDDPRGRFYKLSTEQLRRLVASS
ncbi:MAG: hypothetical protein KC441_00620 [Anaerolineales bacterium]|nr:hypothetical protein [Anaerolineales bacterium]